MAIRSFTKALVNTAFGDGKHGITSPPALPHVSPAQFSKGAPPNGGNGGLTDSIDGIAIPAMGSATVDGKVINEGGSGAV